MDKNTVVEFSGRQETTDPLTELLRRGARELLQQTVDKSTFWPLRMELESTLSWKGVLGKLKEHGMNAPELAIGDGALRSSPTFTASRIQEGDYL